MYIAIFILVVGWLLLFGDVTFAPFIYGVLSLMVEVGAAMTADVGFVTEAAIVIRHTGIIDEVLVAGSWLLGCRGAGCSAHRVWVSMKKWFLSSEL